MQVMSEYLTVEEIAERLKVSTDTVLRLIRRKELIAHKISGTYRVTFEDLQHYLGITRTVKPEER